MVIKKLNILKTASILLILVVTACGSTKPSEKEQVAEIRSSFIFKTYKALSQSSISLVVTGYNKTADSASYQVDDAYFRLLLGYYWGITNHPTFALAEADLLSEKSDSKNVTYLASMLTSCTMYQQGWTTLAKEESDKGISLAATNGDKTMVETETIIFHLLVGTVCVQQENYDAAKFHFAGLGELTGMTFPYKLIDIMIDIKKGDIKSGIEKAKLLSNDATLPESIRTELKSIVASVEKKGGNVTASLFWPKFISSVMVDELKKSSEKGISGLMGLLQKEADKLK
jgi:hypothetical protein